MILFTLNAAGSVASLLGFLVTIWVVFEVRNLHHFYQRHLQIPPILRALRAHVKNADSALQGKRTDQVKRILSSCDALVERLLKYGDRPLANRATGVRVSISRILDGPEHALLGKGHNVVSEIDAVIASATTYMDENRWQAPK